MDAQTQTLHPFEFVIEEKNPHVYLGILLDNDHKHQRKTS